MRFLFEDVDSILLLYVSIFPLNFSIVFWSSHISFRVLRLMWPSSELSLAS